MRSLASWSPRSIRFASSTSSSAVSRRCRRPRSGRAGARRVRPCGCRATPDSVLPNVRSERNPARTSASTMPRVPALTPPVLPQLARSRAELPEGDGLVLRAEVGRVPGDRLRRRRRELPPVAQRQAAEPLLPRARVPQGRYVLDGELVILDDDGKQDFDALQQRIHPAASRIARLAEEMPARFVAFDLLAADGESLLEEPFERRRERLEKLVAQAARAHAVDARPRGGGAVAAGRRGRDREAARRSLPARRADRDGEDQARAHDRLRGRRAGARARRRARSAR